MQYTDRELISFSLNLWANYIETYIVSISAADARKKVYFGNYNYEPNMLTAYQINLVKRLRELAIIYGGEKDE